MKQLNYTVDFGDGEVKSELLVPYLRILLALRLQCASKETRAKETVVLEE